MPKTLPVGPYKQVDLGGGATAPWYVIPFDKRGTCVGPKTRAHLVEACATGHFTHIFVFCHGWNNDWQTAIARYEDFIATFGRVRRQQGLSGAYRPLLVGVFWPSTALVLPWEKAPKIAALPGGGNDPDVEESLGEIADIADSLPEAQRGRFYELANAPQLGPSEALELARILRPLYAQAEDPDPDRGEAPSAESLVEAWRALPRPPAAQPAAEEDPDSFGFAGDAGTPAAAAGLEFLDPRGALRAVTVYQMKDRAGLVGAAGVAPLLRDVVAAAPGARVHLLGHSYGCKVVLSALAAPPLPANKSIESVLLLQPAINGWAFAADVAGKGFPGAYRKTVDALRQPVFTTFTKHDVPLTKFFHLAVRREGDLGEVKIAALAPSRFAALGGFGPQGLSATESSEIEMPAAGGAYPGSAAGVKVVALRADARIAGHGDVVNDATAWALLSQVRAGGAA